jgi:predicted GIY-YIG superfamily endonuclease
MPKLPVDYSKTIIYKLVHNEDYDNANIYIGSTTDFVKRKNKHKSCCSNEKDKNYNEKKYQYIRDNGGWECFNMIEIEKHNCKDGNEARAREEYWRCHFNSQLNTKRAYITDEQRKELDKERKREYREHERSLTNMCVKRRCKDMRKKR